MSQLPENSDLRALIQNQAKAEETVIEDIANIDKKLHTLEDYINPHQKLKNEVNFKRAQHDEVRLQL